ncbi:MAG: CZB domain-containing protein [Magnetococcales bacterium]|nr:CZB domain-containing protein [Magnetococcales bacterium]
MPSFLSIFHPIRQSVSRKILFMIGCVGTASLLALGAILIHHMKNALQEENQNAVIRIAETATQGLQAIMLAGQAPMAHDYMEKLKQVEGLETIRIFRTDGSEAFRHDDSGSRLAPELDPPFQQTLTSRQRTLLASTGADGAGRMTILAPIPNREPCHACHGGDHAIRGVFQLTISRAASETRLAEARTVSMLVMLGAIPLLIVLIHLVLIRLVRRPMERLNEAIQRISDGDLTHAIPVPKGLLDDLGQIAQGFNAMTVRFRETIRQVVLQSHSMAACVGDLLEVRNGLAADSMTSFRLAEETARDHQQVEGQVAAIQQSIAQTTEQIGIISIATEQFSAHIGSIASGADQASGNIGTMASAAEEITNNIASVNQNLSQVDRSVATVAAAVREVTESIEGVRLRCQQASEESRQANDQAQGTHNTMTRLANSAQEIDQVLEMINSIASQTNMLALNASIEAAGAGEAGKGFAVVANEVKELARQTADATRLIAAKIQEIQENTREVATATDQIASRIESIDATNSDITQAVDEQAHSIHAISDSIREVSLASGEVTRSAGELDLASRDIARSAQEAANGALDVARAAAEAASSAATLARQSDEIHTIAQEVSRSAQVAAEATTRANHKVRAIHHNSVLVNGAIHHVSLLIDSVAVPGRHLVHSVQDLRMEPEPFAVEKIKGAHLKWLGKLENVIRGRSDLKPEQVASGRECDFGKWYYSEGTARFGSLEIFRLVGEVHLEVHELARETVRLVTQGDVEGAEKKMDAFSALKDRLFALMDELYMVSSRGEAADATESTRHTGQ